MWDWTEATVEPQPHLTDLRPGPRGQTPTVTPASLPSNVLQVVTPPALPDPTGLAGALRLLGTQGIFRDMSGLRELLGNERNAAAIGHDGAGGECLPAWLPGPGGVLGKHRPHLCQGR